MNLFLVELGDGREMIRLEPDFDVIEAPWSAVEYAT